MISSSVARSSLVRSRTCSSSRSLTSAIRWRSTLSSRLLTATVATEASASAASGPAWASTVPCSKTIWATAT